MLVKCCIIFLLLYLDYCGCDDKQEYKIGGLFSDENLEMTFRLATERMNDKYQFSQLRIYPETYEVTFHNSFDAYQGTCNLLKKGIIGLFGPSSEFSSPYVQAICDTKEIPHIETHYNLQLARNDTLVNVHPHPDTLSNIFIDLIELFGWDKIIVIYETDSDLLSIASVLELNNHQHRNVILKQLECDDGENYRPMLTNLKMIGGNEFVLVCSIDILGEVLSQLQQVGMMTETYSYIITNLDMQTIDLSPYQYAGTNITGVRMINPEQQGVVTIAESLQGLMGGNTNLFENIGLIAATKMRMKTALLMDAVHLFFETIYDLTMDNNLSIKAQAIFCNSNDNWVDGYTIINLMKTKSIEGLTGLVKFDVEGFRKDFKIDLLELTPGGLIQVGSWNSTDRKVNIDKPYTPLSSTMQNSNIFNRTFTVLISISPPYGMLTETTTQLIGNDQYEGFGVDVIDELSKMLGFNYTFILQADGANGNFNKTTNQWNGMIREIIDGRADLAITDLTVTSEREKAVDFTMPFMNLGISILYRKPEPVPPSLFMFASPFSLLVWIMLGVSYFIVSLAFFIMGRLSPSEWQNPYPCVEEPEYLINQFTVRNSLWFTIGALMQQGTELAPIAICTRTASGIWWFFVLIMVSSYTANLAAFLTVTTLVTSFKNVEELAKQTEIKYGAKLNGATANYFRDSNVSTYKKIWAYMVEHPELMMTVNDEGVAKVEKENYAFLMESTTIEYVTERHCSLAQVGGLLDDKGYAIAMKKDSPYRNDLSTAVVKLQEMGTLTRLKIKWWKEKRGGGNCASKAEGAEATALDLKNVGGVFLVLFVGSILALMGSLAELSCSVYRKCKKEKISFKEELTKEMRFILKFKQGTKEVNTVMEDNSDNTLIDNTKY